MIDIKIMQDASEVISYDSEEVPFAVQERRLSDYSGMRALSHWHEDFEMIYIIEGRMCYDINGQRILLSSGDCLLVNAKQLHFGYSYHQEDCQFTVLLLHPELFQCNISLFQHYVQPVLENSQFEFLHLKAEERDWQELTDLIKRIVVFRRQKERRENYRLMGLFYELWDILWAEITATKTNQNDSDDAEIALQKQMIRYIYRHYQEQITLDDIAASGNICRSKCCRIFQKYLKQSPNDYLNAYRLEVSKKLLQDTSYSITQIAMSCGYNYTSYYSRIFFKRYKESPRDYRKKRKTENVS